jgi:type II secretory pathway pseudopilin PulG
MQAGEGGFTYVGLLAMVAISGVALSATGVLWQTEAKREKERELLFAGNQFRRAIEQYYVRTPSAVRTFPRTLEDLVYDTRGPVPMRHLRRIYADPMTGRADWELIAGPGGSIVGVHSRSLAKPFKQRGFRARDASFSDKERYAEWKFVYSPPPNAPARSAAKPGAKPAAKPVAPAPAATKG